MNSADDGTTVFGGNNMVLDEEKDLSFGTTFFRLWDMDIHFIAIEVCVIGRSDLEVETESAVGHDTDQVGHYGHTVEGGLAIKEDDITIAEVAFDDELRGEVFGDGGAISDIAEINAAAVGADDIVGARKAIGTDEDQVFHAFHVPFSDTFGNGEGTSDFEWDANFIDAEIGIRTDNGASREINAFTGEVAAETAFFAFKALGEGAEGTAGAMAGGGNAGDFIIKEGSDVVLEEFPEIFDNKLRGACLDIFAEALINANGIDEFMGEIVFRANASFEDDGRADGDGGDRENGEDNPFWAGIARIKA